jgi:hypothetical protein
MGLGPGEYWDEGGGDGEEREGRMGIDGEAVEEQGVGVGVGGGGDDM